MKTTINLSHFGLSNTPAIIEKIGNILLILAGVGTLIMGLPATMAAAGVTGFILPVFLVTIAKLCMVAGVFGKIITKMFGVKTDDGAPVIQAPAKSLVSSPVGTPDPVIIKS